MDTKEEWSFFLRFQRKKQSSERRGNVLTHQILLELWFQKSPIFVPYISAQCWSGSPWCWLILSTLSKTQQASGETAWCFMLAVDIQSAAGTSRVQLRRGKDQMSHKLLHPVGTVPNTNSSSSLLYPVTTIALYLIFVHLLLPLNLPQLTHSHRVPVGLRQRGWI